MICNTLITFIYVNIYVIHIYIRIRICIIDVKKERYFLYIDDIYTYTKFVLRTCKYLSRLENFRYVYATCWMYIWNFLWVASRPIEYIVRIHIYSRLTSIPYNH